MEGDICRAWSVDDALAEALAGRRAYHAAPLHYLPSILCDGALYAKDVLAARGIAPRASAHRRDRMLGLGSYIHFSLCLDTPLLRDKLSRGYPHVVLAFDAAALAALPGSALLRGNTKAWRSRADLAPVDAGDCDAAARLLALDSKNEAPRVELLVKYAVDLEHMGEIILFSEKECTLVKGFIAASGVREAAVVVRYGPVACKPAHMGVIDDYFALCTSLRTALKPPNLAYD